MNAVLDLRSRLLFWSALVARVLVGGLFVATGAAKIVGLERFVDEVRKYDMIFLPLTNALAYFVPWLEVFAGALLVLGLWRREARWIIAAMLVVFTIAKSWAYARGLAIECGCGGELAFLKYIFELPQGILTNLVLLGLLGIDSVAQRHRDSSGPRPRTGLLRSDCLSWNRMVHFASRREKGLLGMNWTARQRARG